MINLFITGMIHTCRKYTEKELGFFTFPGGEESVKFVLDPDDAFSIERVFISLKRPNTKDIFRMQLLLDSLRRQIYSKNVEYILDIPYLPYARQDRRCATGESFSLKVFADIINNLKFDEVLISDCHSDVGLALINNSTNVPQDIIVGDIHDAFEPNLEDCVLCVPDAGAFKKSFKVLQRLGISEYILGEKIRDLDTGEIKNTKLYDNSISLENRRILIVDDICDGGRTFIELAKVLKKEYKVGQIILIVSHGIFSKGLVPLKNAGIELFYTTDSVVDVEKITLIDGVSHDDILHIYGEYK